MNQLVDRNKFINNFLKQFKGRNLDQILDSVLVIGANQVISNFKPSTHLSDDIIKASKKIQSFFQTDDQEQLKDEINLLREEINRLNAKFDDRMSQQNTQDSSFHSPPRKLTPQKQSQERDQKIQGVKRFPLQDQKNSSIKQQLKQDSQMTQKFNDSNQKRITRSSSLNTVSNSHLKKQQQVALKVTQVVPSIPKPVKYTPKYHHLNDEQIKSVLKQEDEQFEIENDQNFINRSQEKRNQRQPIKDYLPQQKIQQTLSQQKPTNESESKYDHHNNQIINKQNNLNGNQVNNNLIKKPPQNKCSKDISYYKNSHNLNYKCPDKIQQFPYNNTEQHPNQFYFNIQQQQSQNGLNEQISPKFNELIVNYHNNQGSSNTEGESFNQNHNNSDLRNDQYYNDSMRIQNDSHRNKSQNESLRHKSQKGQINQSLDRNAPRIRSNNSHHTSKGTNKQSPSSQKNRQRSQNSVQCKKIYYDPRKMKRGEIFDPINNKRETENYKKVESKIRGDIQQHKFNKQNYGNTNQEAEQLNTIELDNGDQQMINVGNSQNNLSYYQNNASYQQNNASYQQINQQQNISGKKKQYNQNYFQQQQQQQNQQNQQQYVINEDSAQFEDRPRQINQSNNNSINNTFNKSRSYTATTAATGTPYNVDIHSSQNYQQQPFQQTHFNYAKQKQNMDSHNQSNNQSNIFKIQSNNVNNNSQMYSGQKQMHQDSTGSFTQDAQHARNKQGQQTNVHLAKQMKVDDSYNQNFNQSQQKQQVESHYDQGEESDPIIHEDDPYIQENSNYQMSSGRLYGNGGIQQQQYQYPFINESINNGSYLNHTQQYYLKSNNISMQGAPNQQRTNQQPYPIYQERPSNKTDNSFQDQSSIIHNPFAAVMGRNTQQRYSYNKMQLNGSFSKLQPSQNITQQNITQQEILNNSNMANNPFKTYNPNQQSYNFGADKISYSQIENQKKSNILDNSNVHFDNYKGGMRQSANIHDQRQRDIIYQGRVANSQQLRQSDPNSFQQQANQQNQKYFNYNNYINQSQEKFDPMRASNSDNQTNYIHNHSQNQNVLNSTQRSKMTTDRSLDQQNTTNKKNLAVTPPENKGNNNYRHPGVKQHQQQIIGPSSSKKYHQNSYSQSNQKQDDIPYTDKYELSASANKYDLENSNQKQYRQSANKQYQPHETFTNRQDNMCDYSISSRDAQSPPLRIQYSGEGSIDGEHFTPFVISEQGKKVFQDDKLFFKDSQQQSQSRPQTLRSEQ